MYKHSKIIRIIHLDYALYRQYILVYILRTLSLLKIVSLLSIALECASR